MHSRFSHELRCLLLWGRKLQDSRASGKLLAHYSQQQLLVHKKECFYIENRADADISPFYKTPASFCGGDQISCLEHMGKCLAAELYLSVQWREIAP
jgi:hypothetical protein